MSSGLFGGGGDDVEQTVKNEPWGPLQPYLAGGYINRPAGTGQSPVPSPGGVPNQGLGTGWWYNPGSDNSLILGQGGGQPSPGSTWGNTSGQIPVRGLWDLSYEQAMRDMSDAYRFGPLSKQARDSLLAKTQGPSGLETAARQQFKDTIEGDYLYGGPGFNAAYNAAANKIIPQVSSMFSGGGRLNSGLAQGAMTSNLGDAFAGLYNQERARQLAAATQYPSMQQAQLQRLGIPLALGQEADQLRRQRMFAPQQQLGWLGQQLGTVPTGNMTTTSEPNQSSLLGNLLGIGSMALGGYGLWNNLAALPLFGGGSAAAGNVLW